MMQVKNKKLITVLLILILLVGITGLILLYHFNSYNKEEQKPRVAIIDSGISEEQKEDTRIMASRSFVNEVYGYSVTEESVIDGIPHGKYVTEIILESKNIEVYIAKIASATGELTIEGLRAALNWAINEKHVDIINLSLGYEGRFHDLLDESLKQWIKDGVSIVTAAGNQNQEGVNAWGSITYPATSPYVISVGAVDQDNNVLVTSSQGPGDAGIMKPDLVANGIAHTIQGTSFAAPRVTKVLAELWFKYYETTKQEPPIGLLWWALLSSTTPLQPTELTGHGLLNELKAGIVLDEYLQQKQHHALITPTYPAILNEPVFTNESRVYAFQVLATQAFTLTCTSNASINVLTNTSIQNQYYSFIMLQLTPLNTTRNNEHIALDVTVKWAQETSEQAYSISYDILFKASKGAIGLSTQFSLLREGTAYGSYWEAVKYLHGRNYSVIFYDYYLNSIPDFQAIQAMLVLDVGTRLLLAENLLYSLGPSQAFIQGFQSFIEHGGRAIIASKYGFLVNASSINALLDPFHITYNENFTAPLTASNINYMYENTVQIITEKITSPLFSTVLKFSYRGATLNIDSQASTGIMIMANASLYTGKETIHAPVIVKAQLGSGTILASGASMLFDNLAFQNGRATSFDMYLAINAMLFLTGFISI